MWFRRLFVLFILLSMFFVFGCDSDDDDDDDSQPADDDVADDDTGEAYDEPWNDPPVRPVVSITSPTTGQFFSDATVSVSGTVTGLDVDSVLVNGEAVAVNSGTFQTTVYFGTGETVLPIYVSAEGPEGEPGADRVVVLRGEMSDPQEPIADALLLALGNEIFPALNALLANLFTQTDYTALLGGGKTVHDGADGSLALKGLSVGGATVQGQWTDGGLQFAVELTDLALQIEKSTGEKIAVNFTAAKIGLEIETDATIVDGAATIAIASIDIYHEDATLEGLSDTLTNLLLGAAEGLIEMVVRSALPGVLEGALSDLGLQTTLIGLNMELALTTLDIATGASVAGLDLNVYLTDPASHPWPNGSLFTPGAAPDLLTARPEAATSFGMGFALADDFLNRFLFGLAEADLLNLAIDDTGVFDDALELGLNAGTLATFMPSFGAVDPQTPVAMKLFPNVPPLTLTDETGALFLLLPDYRVEVYMLPQGLAPWRALELSASLTFGIDANVTNDGALLIAVPVAATTLQALDNPIGESGLFIDPLAEWLTDLVQPLLDLLLGSLPIKLPPLLGVQAVPLSIGPTGENLDYWTWFLGLDVVE